MRRDISPPSPDLFERFATHDQFKREITFYLSKPPSSRPGSRPATHPVALYIQGSGCHSLFQQHSSGLVHGGYQNLLLSASNGQARILAVEKPGVTYLDPGGRGGTARACRAAFNREHTLPRWTAALDAAMKSARAFQGINLAQCLVVGHSEGGIAAAHLAAINPSVTHVALISSSGPTQLFDLMVAARLPKRTRESPAAAAARVHTVIETFQRIRADPTSATRMAWGHPHRRWATFLATSTLDELLRSQAAIYLAHGSADTIVPIEAFEMQRAELIRHARNVTAERIEGADHSLRLPSQEGIDTMQQVMTRIMNWFLNSQI